MAHMGYTDDELSKRNSGQPGSICTSMSESEKYPYGLKLTLNKEALAKVDIDKLPEVGTVMKLTGSVIVTEASLRQYHDNTDEKNMELQITDMELGQATEEKKDVAEGLYGPQRDPTKEGKVLMVEG